jgi:methionine-rich copper-binding protein CopC
MKRESILGKALVLSSAVALVVFTTAASLWHLHLTDSFPKTDAMLTEAPDSVRLWFNEEPELALAAISLDGEHGAVEMSEVRETDDSKSIKAEVLGEVVPGEYRVSWRAAGEDGHAVRGSFDFMVHAHSSPERN